jgi:hypothetical protein
MKRASLSGPLYKHLGHFTQQKYLDQGHNDVNDPHSAVREIELDPPGEGEPDDVSFRLKDEEDNQSEDMVRRAAMLTRKSKSGRYLENDEDKFLREKTDVLDSDEEKTQHDLQRSRQAFADPHGSSKPNRGSRYAIYKYANGARAPRINKKGK